MAGRTLWQGILLDTNTWSIDTAGLLLGTNQAAKDGGRPRCPYKIQSYSASTWPDTCLGISNSPLDLIVRLTLVSSSPRRISLLKRLEIPFDVAPVQVHERWDATSTVILAQQNAMRKVHASEHFGASRRMLLGADTVIHHDGVVLGKPAGRESARRMLSRLSGNCHEVVTGYCIMTFSEDGAIKDTCVDASSSYVTFDRLSKSVLTEYLDSNEWVGKAGAYAIQGKAGAFVTTLKGDFDNVVGLPVESIRNKFGTVFSNYQFL